MRKMLLLMLLAIGTTCLGQLTEEISFSEKQFDFGTVKEEDGPIIHEFKFINNSDQPIKILNVKASCGCTTPAWTKEEVKPGEAGFVQAQYNPLNRPGPFNKSLTITTDKSQSPIRLYIKGNVTPKPKTLEDELPTEIGGLRVKYRSLNMGKVLTSDEPTVAKFDIYNSSDSSITFLDKSQTPAYISVSFEPQSLAPEKRGEIIVTYNGKEKNDLGFFNDNIIIYTDQPADQAAKSFSVFATVLEYFPPMTSEELAKAPILKIEEPTHDFGRLSGDSKVETTFSLKNEGESILKIRKTDTNCSCTISQLKADGIKPGKSEELKVIFDAKGRRGNQQKSVTIYTNDPRNPVQRVTIKAYIEE